MGAELCASKAAKESGVMLPVCVPGWIAPGRGGVRVPVGELRIKDAERASSGLYTCSGTMNIHK